MYTYAGFGNKQLWKSIILLTMFWTGQTDKWQTNDRGHSGKEGVWGGFSLQGPDSI